VKQYRIPVTQKVYGYVTVTAKSAQPEPSGLKKGRKK
jgi:hypothetical protein